jgi:C4-type Zn-finger protein
MKVMADKHVQILYQTRIITNSMTTTIVITEMKNRSGPGINSKTFLDRLENIFKSVTERTDLDQMFFQNIF